MQPQAAALAVLLSLATGTAWAQAIHVRAGTTGFGGDVSFPVTTNFGLRINGYGGSVSRSTTESGVHYDARWRFSTAMALADFFPGAGRFRLSAGVAYNANRIDLTGTGTSGTVEINDRTYNISDIGTLTGRLSFNKANPYLGVGWGNGASSLGKGLFFSGDIGILFVKPKVSLNANCGAAFTQAQCDQLQNDLRQEEQQFKDSFSFRSWYPVFSFGMGYRF